MIPISQPVSYQPSLLSGYARQTAAKRFDELCAADGTVRPHWLPLLDLLSDSGPADIRSRLADARKHIRDEGITYTIYADPQGKDRPWAIDELPLLLPGGEWGTLSRALEQRARLLNLVIADIYGPQTLLHQGIIPPEVVYGAGGWLPAACGTSAPDNIFLHSYAADLMRSPDGRWWVAADRTQAPSGTGYALENRMIMTRAFPELLSRMPVAPLDSFFEALRESLARHSPCGNEPPRIVVLTPGPLNETYYEHSLLARYLGFTLAEGGDLTVRDGCVWLKTIGGLQRVHAILRRQDDDYCDPLELRSDSALGVAGLTDCARRGTVLLANALGAGVAESAALLGFLPGACRFLLGEELALPSVATWWCGENAAMDYVRSHLDDLVIKKIHSSGTFTPIFGQDLDAVQRRDLLDRIEASPGRFVAQEWVRLSQAPVLNLRPGSLQLETRSIGLRVYAVAIGQGYRVMPGGLTRVESRLDARIVSMQRGGTSKDTWVLEAPGQETLPDTGTNGIRQPVIHTGVPSRVAENLYWMGRYNERAEGIARLLRLTLSAQMHHTGRHGIAALHELVWHYGLTARPADPDNTMTITLEQLIRCATNPDYRQGLAETLARLGRVGFSLRDRISHDHWRALNRLVTDPALRSSTTLGPVLGWLDRAVDGLATLSGYSLDAMNRDAGWRFLSLGRRLERLVLLGIALTVASDRLSAAGEHGECTQPLDWLLELIDSFGSFRSRNTGIASWDAVREIVLLDATNPRSLRFQVDGVQQALRRLARETDISLTGLTETGDRLAGWSQAGLPPLHELQEVFPVMEQEVAALNDLLSVHFFSLSEPGRSL